VGNRRAGAGEWVGRSVVTVTVSQVASRPTVGAATRAQTNASRGRSGNGGVQRRRARCDVGVGRDQRMRREQGGVCQGDEPSSCVGWSRWLGGSLGQQWRCRALQSVAGLVVEACDVGTGRERTQQSRREGGRSGSKARTAGLARVRAGRADRRSNFRPCRRCDGIAGRLG
jgi:hypothetical protein